MVAVPETRNYRDEPELRHAFISIVGRLLPMALYSSSPALLGQAKPHWFKPPLDRLPTRVFRSRHDPPNCSGEQDVDYHFHDIDSFNALVDDGQMLEWAEVMGTGMAHLVPVEAAPAKGKALCWTSMSKEQSKSGPPCPKPQIFVLPPSIEALETRLRGRSTDSEEVIQKRMAEARYNSVVATNSTIWW